MVPTAFDEENGVLSAPVGMTHAECEALSAWRGNLSDGTPCVISCYKPTAEEWAEIRRTGRVWLLVMGTSMPPVALVGKSPFSSE